MPVGGFGTILAPAISTLGREQEGVVVVNRLRRPFPFLLLFLAIFATLGLQSSHKRDICQSKCCGCEVVGWWYGRRIT